MLNASNCENGLIKLMTVANGMYLVNKYNIVISLQCYVVYIPLSGEPALKFPFSATMGIEGDFDHS